MQVGSGKNRTAGPLRSGAFTLVELLVVLAIIGVLAAILFPVLNKTKEVARISECLSNVKQIGVGLQLYMDSYDSHFPAAAPWGIPGSTNPADKTVQELLSPFVRNGLIRDSDTLMYESGGVFACPSDYGLPEEDENGNKFDLLNGVPPRTVVWHHTGCSYEYYASDQEDYLHCDINAPRVAWTGLSPKVDDNGVARRIGAPLSSVRQPTKKAVLGDIWFWHMGDEVPVCRVAYRNTLFVDGHASRINGARHLESRLEPLKAGWHKFSQAR